jgi:hypothetical protein
MGGEDGGKAGSSVAARAVMFVVCSMPGLDQTKPYFANPIFGRESFGRCPRIVRFTPQSGAATFSTLCLRAFSQKILARRSDEMRWMHRY